jgi:aminopeptidase
VQSLNERGRLLTELGLQGLELRDSGTALDLPLAPGTRWLGGPREQHGRPTSGNLPTEENFTSPEPRGAEGTFRCTRPLAFRGRTIDGIAGEFRGGRLTRLEAATEPDRDFLAAALDVDPGARRLGEVALVDRSSRIGQTGRIYYNTLIDENAAAHIAFGYGFGQSRAAGAKTAVNRSDLHLDVMIGTKELEATGTTADGRRVPLIAGGEWML